MEGRSHMRKKEQLYRPAISPDDDFGHIRQSGPFFTSFYCHLWQSGHTNFSKLRELLEEHQPVKIAP